MIYSAARGQDGAREAAGEGTDARGKGLVDGRDALKTKRNEWSRRRGGRERLEGMRGEMKKTSRKVQERDRARRDPRTGSHTIMQTRGMKRKREDPTQGMSVGIEIETCCKPVFLSDLKSREHAFHFKQVRDASIKCKGGVRPVEFVLKDEYAFAEKTRVWGDRRKERQMWDDVVKILKGCQACKPFGRASTCGVHVHFSRDDYTVTEKPQFGRVVFEEWTAGRQCAGSWQQDLVGSFNLRDKNRYCTPNTADSEPLEKYLMLNQHNSFLEEGNGTWHFECRGMDDIFSLFDHKDSKNSVDYIILNLSGLIQELCRFFRHCVDKYEDRYQHVSWQDQAIKHIQQLPVSDEDTLHCAWGSPAFSIPGVREKWGSDAHVMEQAIRTNPDNLRFVSDPKMHELGLGLVRRDQVRETVKRIGAGLGLVNTGTETYCALLALRTRVDMVCMYFSQVHEVTEADIELVGYTAEEFRPYRDHGVGQTTWENILSSFSVALQEDRRVQTLVEAPTQGMSVGIEIETCCTPAFLSGLKSRERAFHFKQVRDASIECQGNVQPVEFVLKDEYAFAEKTRVWGDPRKERQMWDDVKEILRGCQACRERARFNGSTCGVHVHFSRDDYTVAEKPQFGRVVFEEWTASGLFRGSWQQDLVTRFNLRDENMYCTPNTADSDPLNKYLMLNQHNSLSEVGDGTWHFECRGMDDIFSLFDQEDYEHSVDNIILNLSGLILELCRFFRHCVDKYEHRYQHVSWQEQAIEHIAQLPVHSEDTLHDANGSPAFRSALALTGDVFEKWGSDANVMRHAILTNPDNLAFVVADAKVHAELIRTFGDEYRVQVRETVKRIGAGLGLVNTETETASALGALWTRVVIMCRHFSQVHEVTDADIELVQCTAEEFRRHREHEVGQRAWEQIRRHFSVALREDSRVRTLPVFGGSLFDGGMLL